MIPRWKRGAAIDIPVGSIPKPKSKGGLLGSGIKKGTTVSKATSPKIKETTFTSFPLPFFGNITHKNGEIGFSTSPLPPKPKPSEIIYDVTGGDIAPLPLFGSGIPKDIKRKVSQNVLGESRFIIQTPTIKMPDLDFNIPDLLGLPKDLGKWLLIGGGLLIAILVLPKLAGGKK